MNNKVNTYGKIKKNGTISIPNIMEIHLTSILWEVLPSMSAMYEYMDQTRFASALGNMV